MSARVDRYSSPKPEASVILPPEILDKILEYISANWEGRPTLVACALVATWWTGPSQRRLFSTVSIGEGSYQRWMNGVILSGSKTRFLRYVRSMVHSLRDCGEFFSALHNLRSLTLYNLQRIRTEEIPACFSAFRETLTDLSLCDFTTSFSAFVTFVDYFPNVTTLRLGPSRLVPDERPVPPLSRPLRGKVWVRAVRFGCCNLLNRLADLDLEYDELFAEACGEGRGGREIIMETILRISPGTVKYLRLSSPSKGGWGASIGHFRQLRELRLPANLKRPVHNDFLSRIKSLELRKIVFSVFSSKFPQGTELWTWVDGQLCELVTRLDRAGYRHTLEVEFQLHEGGDHIRKDDLTKLFPEFRDKFKGVVNVVDAPDDWS